MPADLGVEGSCQQPSSRHTPASNIVVAIHGTHALLHWAKTVYKPHACNQTACYRCVTQPALTVIRKAGKILVVINHNHVAGYIAWLVDVLRKPQPSCSDHGLRIPAVNSVQGWRSRNTHQFCGIEYMCVYAVWSISRKDHQSRDQLLHLPCQHDSTAAFREVAQQRTGYRSCMSHKRTYNTVIQCVTQHAACQRQHACGRPSTVQWLHGMQGPLATELPSSLLLLWLQPTGY